MDSTSHPLFTYHLIRTIHHYRHQTLQNNFIYPHYFAKRHPNQCLREATNPLYRTGLMQITARDKARKKTLNITKNNKQAKKNPTPKPQNRQIYHGGSRMKLAPSREKKIISCISEERQRKSTFYTLYQGMKSTIKKMPFSVFLEYAGQFQFGSHCNYHPCSKNSF